MRNRSIFGMLCMGVLSTVLPGAALGSQNPPSRQAPPRFKTRPPSAATSPVRIPILRLARPIPELAATDVPPAASVARFIERASMARVDERDAIRAVIVRARGNLAVSRALAATVFNTRTADFTRTLTSLAVLGELRNPTSEAALTSFVRMPLPTQGHLVEGEVAERITLEELQMKAVQGLAYAKTRSANAEVLRVIAQHPSRPVRAEAIEAYLYNHRYSAAAKAKLLTVVHSDERIFIDRPHMLPTTTKEDFNGQLSRYLASHPELRAPALRSHHLVSARIDRIKDAAAIPQPNLQPPALR